MPSRPDDHQDRARARRIAAAGWFIIALSAGAALLPLIGPAQGALVIGAMLVLAGLAELLAGTMRHQTRMLAMLAGVITVVAGLLFSTDQATMFAPTLIIIAGWLFLRSLTLAIASARETGSVRHWTGLAAAADFILAVVLAVGLSAAVLVISLFGPTQPMIAHFAWILAISFVATGSMLLEVARCARREDV
jgi:ABC-type Mn2+/Zn2+ transport system permease subunit